MAASELLLACGLVLGPGFSGVVVRDDAALALARDALRAGDLSEALEASLAVAEPLEASLLRAEIYHRARDFPALLREVTAGLEREPENLVLLWRGATAELWLQDGAAARPYVERLSAAVAALPEAERGSWSSTVESYDQQARSFEQRAQGARLALTRARRCAAAILAGAVALLALLARRST